MTTSMVPPSAGSSTSSANGSLPGDDAVTRAKPGSIGTGAPHRSSSEGFPSTMTLAGAGGLDHHLPGFARFQVTAKAPAI
jgi:hypothetical protein